MSSFRSDIRVMMDSSTPGNKRSLMKEGWKSHPIYKLRRNLIYNDIAGLALCIFSLFGTQYEIQTQLISALVVLSLSLLLALADLKLWAAEKKSQRTSYKSLRCNDCRRNLTIVNNTHTSTIQPETPAVNAATPLLSVDRQNAIIDSDNVEDKSTWPKKWILILDFIFALVLAWLWLAAAFNIGYCGYYCSETIVIKAYATITLLVGSLLHLRSWWTALMARKEAAWKEELNATLSGPRLDHIDTSQSLLPIFEPQQNATHQDIEAYGALKDQHLPTSQHEQVQKFFSPFAWLGAKQQQTPSQQQNAGARRGIYEETQKVLAKLTPSSTGSTSYSSIIGNGKSYTYKDNEDDTANVADTSTTINDYSRGRATNRSAIFDKRDAVDEYAENHVRDVAANDTPGAAGMEEDEDDTTAVIVKKKVKKHKSGNGTDKSGKKSKKRLVEIEDEA